MYEIRWTNTAYQTAKYFKIIPRSKVEDGIRNHLTVSGGILNKASWRNLCNIPEGESWDVDQSLDDYVILDGSTDLFIPQQILPDNLEVVEQLTSLDF